VALLASVLAIVTEPVVAVALNESVEMEPVEEMLVSAVRVTLSVAVTEPVTATSAVVDDRVMLVPDTEPASVRVPEEVTSKLVPAELEPVKVAEPLLTVVSTEPVLADSVRLVSPVTVRSILVLA